MEGMPQEGMAQLMAEKVTAGKAELVAPRTKEEQSSLPGKQRGTEKVGMGGAWRELIRAVSKRKKSILISVNGGMRGALQPKVVKPLNC